MANTYFEFKQFTVHQEQCAMKVCTDACLFGAWVAELIQQKPVQRLLDIGTGTGLLSLMLAQKSEAGIDAAELDYAAFDQAGKNFNLSPWSNRLQALHTDIVGFAPHHQYDLIISNPPFFEDDLKSSNQQKNNAKHDTSLTLEQLFTAAEKLLLPSGLFAVLLPYHRMGAAIPIANKLGLSLHQKMLARQTPAHPWFRCVLLFGFNATAAPAEEVVTIKKDQSNYSERFVELLQDYYLYL